MNANAGREPERDGDHGNRLTRLSSFLFLHTEHAVYAALGGLLAVTALLALLDSAGLLVEAVKMCFGVQF